MISPLVPHAMRTSYAMQARATHVETLLQRPCSCHPAADPTSAVEGADASRRPHIAARLLRPFLRHVATQSRLTNAPPWSGASDTERVPLALANDWIEQISRERRAPRLGLDALRELRRGDGDVVELAAASAATLHSALHTLIRHVHLACDAVALHLHVADESAALVLRFKLPLSHVVRDFLAGALLQALRMWLGNPVGFALWSPGPPRVPPSQLASAPFPMHGGASREAIVFPAVLLPRPLRGADEALHAVLDRCAQRLTAAQASRPSVADEVRRCLAPLLPGAASGAFSIAQRMGMSRRTLTRRLAREGISFSTLLDDVRNRQALYYLENSALSPQEIAQRLGYSGTATFCRAFLRWHGVSPLRHRRAHAHVVEDNHPIRLRAKRRMR